MKRAVVVDLDQTLLSVNTFKHYILFVAKEALRVSRFDIVILLAWWVILRKIRGITHEVMKLHILKCSEQFMNLSRLELFVNEIIVFLNNNVYDSIEKYRLYGYYICLSSAAPISYVSLIAKHFSFDGYLGTLMPSKAESMEWKENVKDEKCKNTLTYLREHDAEIDILITDHYDDLPLLKVPKTRNFVVLPTEKTVSRLQEWGIDYDLL